MVCDMLQFLIFNRERRFLFLTFKKRRGLFLLVYGNVKLSRAKRRLLIPFLLNIPTPTIQIMIFFPVTNHDMMSSLKSKSTLLGPLNQNTVLGQSSQLWIFHWFNQLKQILNGICGSMTDITHHCFGFYEYCTGQQIYCCTCTCTALSTFPV